jgi:hypothetical protein
MLDKQIATRDLKVSDIPDYAGNWINRSSDREDLSCIDFALSFNGDAFTRADWGRYIDLATNIKSLHEVSPEVLKCFGTTGLRLLLYMEQRRAKWGEATEISPYVRSIVGALRKRLTA